MKPHPRGASERPPDARLPDVLEAMPDAALVIDSTGRILLLNAQTERLFGHATGELAGQSIDMLVAERHHALARAHLDNACTQAGACTVLRLELQGRRRDESEIPVEMSLCALKTSDATMVISTIRDIIERHVVEEALNEKNAELEAANKELEAFDYSIAHDLRAPLHRIEGFAAMLEQEQGEKLDAHGRDVLRRIAEAGKTMDQLVTDLLTLATATRGTLERSVVDVTALARSIDATLRKSEAPRDVEFVVSPGMKARVDSGLLRAVVQNLLGNAWKFTRGRARARIEMGCSMTGAEHVFFVRDNGVGFDPAQAQSVFKAFQRLHAGGDFEGSGIGLATVQRIVRRHGGRVWAEGRVDQGASFFFTLSRPSPPAS
jgi:PAS domain S-box-containing protein